MRADYIVHNIDSMLSCCKNSLELILKKKTIVVKITEKISQKKGGIFISRMLQIHVQIRNKKTQKSVSFVRIFIQKIKDLDAVLLEILLEIAKGLIFLSSPIFARTLIGVRKMAEMLSYVIAKWKARK